MKKPLLVLFLLVSCVSCASRTRQNPIERTFIRAGLVDVHSVDPSIQVDLVNSSRRKNFFRRDFYDGLERAYLHKKVAKKLARAQKLLKKKHPTYSLLILDSARPRSVSQEMWDEMEGTRFQKFVANPRKGSMHNYGVAVDITIVNARGRELDMGFTPFRKSLLAIAISYRRKKRRNGRLTKEQAKNRKLLRSVMKRAGFYPLSFEWWHFDGVPKAVARRRYKIIE